MNVVGQVANAGMVILFVTVMAVVGHMYMQGRAEKLPALPAAQMVSMYTHPF
jgi:hypothetical protein